jgi:hypothetical protein
LRGPGDGLRRSADGRLRDVKQAIANKIIALSKAGERNPDILCEKVLNDIRRPQMEAESSTLWETHHASDPERRYP